MAAPREIHDLVARFHQADRDNETQIRVSFINPFFAALGWDVRNERGQREVIHEDRVYIKDRLKHPDYGFYLGRRLKFFVEAKQASVNLEQDPEPALQLRSYGWSAKLPLSVVTDFEEFVVYDCRIPPDPRKDSARTARTQYFTYRQYPDRWDEIAAFFSREAVRAGSLDRFAEKKVRGTLEVDDAFLAELDEWRVLLARNIALRNPNLSQRDLNFAVQMLIDRLVFLRIAEDREIEPADQLRQAARADDVYGRLRDLFQRADQYYNSGLFHFSREPGRPNPDTLTPGLIVDNDTLRTIISRLYYPASPYEFSVMPADILGQVYERFLGKVIRLTPGHRAKVEEKPEVRKAGGVYYTPTYIVEYIVQNTVGALLPPIPGPSPTSEGRESGAPLSPSPLAGRAGVGSGRAGVGLRILDPACGSGSFLLGAYQSLCSTGT